MYKLWNTSAQLSALDGGTTDDNSGRALAEEIDLYRKHVLVGIVNQHLGHLPSSLRPAQYSSWKGYPKPVIGPGEPNYDPNDWEPRNSWLDFLLELRVYAPKNCSNEYLMTCASGELNILINGDDNLGFSGNIPGVVPIDDPDLLDLFADFLGGLDGIFGLILATNPNISPDLRSELMTSDYYLTLPDISTKSLLKDRD